MRKSRNNKVIANSSFYYHNAFERNQTAVNTFEKVAQISFAVVTSMPSDLSLFSLFKTYHTFHRTIKFNVDKLFICTPE